MTTVRPCIKHPLAASSLHSLPGEPVSDPRLVLPSSNHSYTGVKPSLNPGDARETLPCVCHREATALADAFIHQQLSEKAGRVPGRAARRNLWRRGSVPGQLGQLQLQVHLLFESPDVNLGLGSGEFPGRLPGRHRCGAGRAASAQGSPRERIPRAAAPPPPLMHRAALQRQIPPGAASTGG